LAQLQAASSQYQANLVASQKAGAPLKGPNRKAFDMPEDLMMMYSNCTPSGEGRGDTVMRMFMENQHREKIKQIYAQTGKILEETLTNQGGISS
jgi:hypothetical protein